MALSSRRWPNGFILKTAVSVMPSASVCRKLQDRTAGDTQSCQSLHPRFLLDFAQRSTDLPLSGTISLRSTPEESMILGVTLNPSRTPSEVQSI